MRIELAGSLVHPDPLVITSKGENFDTAKYLNLGFTHFEVICIGGGGGAGGGVDNWAAGQFRASGGAGGGGGFHRVRGLLSALPAVCPVVVGGGGAPGTVSGNPALTTDGGDGAASTFNTNTCRASGGKGGKRAQSNSNTVNPQSNGGDGGVGNRTTAGGGAAGGLSGTPGAGGPSVAGTPGQDGTFFPDIGKGGGGGAGGYSTYNGPLNLPATAGGRGSYNPGDTSVYGPGLPPVADIAGGASGAKAAPLNGLPTVYGQSSTSPWWGWVGAVIIRLTAE